MSEKICREDYNPKHLDKIWNRGDLVRVAIKKTGREYKGIIAAIVPPGRNIIDVAVTLMPPHLRSTAVLKKEYDITSILLSKRRSFPYVKYLVVAHDEKLGKKRLLCPPLSSMSQES